jgi:hypothetical protein
VLDYLGRLKAEKKIRSEKPNSKLRSGKISATLKEIE